MRQLDDMRSSWPPPREHWTPQGGVEPSEGGYSKFKDLRSLAAVHPVIALLKQGRLQLAEASFRTAQIEM